MASVFNLKSDLEPHLPPIAADDNAQPTSMNRDDNNSTDQPRRKRIRPRVQEYMADRKNKDNRARKKREKRRVTAGLLAALPCKTAKEVRGEYKLVKSMGLFADTIKDTFATGFIFPDNKTIENELMRNDETENLCRTLILQGSQNCDAARLHGFALSLVHGCKDSRDTYEKGAGAAAEDVNGHFFEEVARCVHKSGVTGGGLTPWKFSMKELTPATCRAMLKLLVIGRKAYLRDLAGSLEPQEAVCNKKVAWLVKHLDEWLEIVREDVEMGENELVSSLDRVTM
ncbi:hypothetical protein K4K54_010572 [Colletotrichum sp. SAR 10_86]|nr:hypothetical protein K4K54_010572 [Colletotrichum sp. SAR 10_86]